jgi:PTS system nitrogen regulatory IIA component
MRLEPLLNPELVIVLDDASDKDAVLRALANAARKVLPHISEDDLVTELADRERRHSTSTPEGVAFPHAMLSEIESTVVVPALVRPGVNFGSDSHPPSDLVFGMFGCAERPFSHVRLLARLARISRGPGALDRLRSAKDPEELYSTLVEEDRRHG